MQLDKPAFCEVKFEIENFSVGPIHGMFVVKKSLVSADLSNRRCRMSAKCSFLRIEDPNMRQRAVYQIPCHDCDFSYIGETKRSFSIRKKEHLAHIRHLRFDKSALTNDFLTTNIPWIGPTLKFSISNLTSRNAGLSSRIS